MERRELCRPSRSRRENSSTKAFTTNEGDPDYRKLTTTSYHDGESEHRMQIPEGDVLHQFRADVQAGKLPTVSWVVPPERFSDHPSSPWYGAWYLSEVFDILTQNPEVWKKTIFILCYDENDGYFDHVPPFMAPHPDRPETGCVSAGIDTSVEQLSPEQEQALRRDHPGTNCDPIGLGYRVPLVIASPWSRGGQVCSAGVRSHVHTANAGDLPEPQNRPVRARDEHQRLASGDLWRFVLGLPPVQWRENHSACAGGAESHFSMPSIARGFARCPMVSRN